ncbi:MAG: DNA repair protein RadC [Bacteroidales bacterium]|nr:DNA repair protein RadC [Bacteroidales bacterium]
MTQLSNIKQWSTEDRPREKMMQKGTEALSKAELLAILLRSGSRGESAVDLAKKMLARAGDNLCQMGKWRLDDFMQYKGMGEAKALTIMAALELGKRRSAENVGERVTVTSPETINSIFQPLLCDLGHEEFWVLMLNQGGRVIDKERISSGGITQTAVDVRLILRAAILRQATQIAIVHNHPSGNLRPSVEDLHLTQRVKQACEAVNIRLIDHLIIVDGGFYSFNDHDEL